MVRVKKSEKPARVNVSSRIDPKLKDRLEALADERSWTVSQYIEFAIADHVESLPTPTRKPKLP